MSDGLGIRAYARHRGVNHHAVQKAIKAGRLSESLSMDAKGRTRIDPVLADREWAASTNSELAHTTPAAPPTPTAPSFAQSKAIREAYLAKTARLNYESLNGDLVKAADVKRDAFKIHRIARDALLNIPSRLAPTLAGMTDRGEIQDAIQREIAQVLEDLADAHERN